MATVSDVASGLPIQARGLESSDLYRHLNYDVKNDIREYLYSDFESTFTGEMRIELESISAPTVALSSSAGNVDNGEYRYKISYVKPIGEIPVGRESDVVTVVDNTSAGQIEITEIPTGGSDVTARKIYRQQNGSGDYLLVATISDNTTTTYTDNIDQASLGAKAKKGYTLPSNYYDLKSLKLGDYDVQIVERADTSTYPNKNYAWLDYEDNPDGTSSQVICFPDEWSETSIFTLLYWIDIGDVSDLTDTLPYPLSLHAKLLPILRLGVAFYHLSELSGEDDHVAKIGSRYDVSIINTFVGNITHTY